MEQEITDLALKKDITPCHTGALKVYLDITGALDTSLHGYIACQCETKLVVFNGLANASKLEFTILNKEIK